MKTRRDFLKRAAFGAAAVTLPQLVRAAEGRRPNFLFILTDDQRWDALGCVQKEQGAQARFPWFQTPHEDRLAAEGVRFRNAFVTLSLCAPSRACFLTGRYNHLNGIANNFTEFNPATPTWATALRTAGYRTGFIGKWHMNNQRGQRPGFDYSASFIGHARYVDAPFEINGVEQPTHGWVDDVATDYASAFIRESQQRPWALAVCYKAPHGPFEPPARWADKFAGQAARVVPNFGAPPSYPLAHPPAPAPATDTVPVNLNYFRCIAAADENVGRLLALLDELKLADDTVIVFAGDNGFYLGEHGLGDKRSTYEESLRIPMLVRYPRLGVRGKALDELVLNIDMAPTWLDFAGVPLPPDMQGRSWRPLLEGKATEWRRSFFFEYFWEPQKGSTVPSLTGVRTTAAKLIRYKDHDEWTELFDLAHDPYELKNLYRDPAAAELRAELEAEYERQAKAVGWVWPAYASDPAKYQGPAPLKAWVLDYRFDHDEGAKVTDASGHNNHGAAKGALPTEGRAGHKARRFDGNAWIEVPRSPSLNPGVGAWTLEATFQADKPDGIVLAHGGATMGYLLALEGGRPLFVVKAAHKNSRVESKREVTGQWVTVTASWNGKNLLLKVDGQPAGKSKLLAALDRLPNDGMQIGADQGSPVMEKPLPKFTGLIERVRIYSGEPPQE